MEAYGRTDPEQKPLNREPPVGELVSSYITTSSKDTDTAVYDRNHGPIPSADKSGDYTLNVYPPLSSSRHSQLNPIPATLAELKSKYKRVTITSALQCAGNRRHTMRTRMKEVNGIDWYDGAIMNCEWTGVKVCDVLRNLWPEVDELLASERKHLDSEQHDKVEGPRAGMIDGGLKGAAEGTTKLERETDESKSTWHTQFECNQQSVQENTWYGASIPLERAMDAEADVLLAWGMNDEPLSEQHGAPLRLVVPGICGARSVKWLDTIRLSKETSPNLYEQRDYKILPPQVTNAEVAEAYWGTVPPLMDMPVNSVVASPVSDEEVKVGEDGLEVTGYAVPAGMGGPVVTVEVSLDDGGAWSQAQLLDSPTEVSKWGWTRWKFSIDRKTLASISNRKLTILSRAKDKGGNLQQECEWNLRGVAYNGYGEARNVSVHVS